MDDLELERNYLGRAVMAKDKGTKAAGPKLSAASERLLSEFEEEAGEAGRNNGTVPQPTKAKTALIRRIVKLEADLEAAKAAK